MRLHNQVALVTGSTQGIGRGIAVRLAEEGADIVINGREEDDEARESLEQVRALGRRVCFIAADVGEVGQCRRLVRESIAQMGRLDILVNNAGVQKHAAFLEVQEGITTRFWTSTCVGRSFLPRPSPSTCASRVVAGASSTTARCTRSCRIPTSPPTARARVG